MLLALGGVAGNHQGARSAQGDGVFENRLSESWSGDAASQGDGAHRIHMSLKADVIDARSKIHRVGADGLSLSCYFHFGWRGVRGFHNDFDWEPLATEHLAGECYRFKQQARLRAPAKSHGING